MSAQLEAALGYASLGRSVIPLAPGGKLPPSGFSWKRYQSERATPDRIHRWWQRDPTFNVGIVTGQISGIVIIDIDPRHGGLDTMAMLAATLGLPVTPEVATPTGGIHLWYLHPGPGIKIPNSAGKATSGMDMPGVDVRGDGGLVVSPPSVRPEGTYTWCEWLCELAPLPEALLDQMIERAQPQPAPRSGWRARVHVRSTSTYATKAAERELAALASVEAGQCHQELTRSAYRLGQLAHLGLDETRIISQLADAALQGAGGAKSRSAALKTATECFTAGKQRPRDPEHAT